MRPFRPNESSGLLPAARTRRGLEPRIRAATVRGCEKMLGQAPAAPSVVDLTGRTREPREPAPIFSQPLRERVLPQANIASNVQAGRPKPWFVQAREWLHQIGLQRLSALRPLTVAVIAPLLCTILAASGHRIEVQVTRDKITAGDLAGHIHAWAGVEPATELDYAPLPGIERRLTQGQIVQWGQSAGIELDPAALPDLMIVSRKMRRLTKDEAEDIVRQAVAREFQVRAEDVGVDLAAFDEPLIPAGELNFALAAPVARLNEAITVSVRWTDRDGRSGVARFRASVAVSGKYAVALAEIPGGTELSGEDFEIRRGALPGNPAEYLLAKEHFEGKTLTRSLKPGEILERRLLRDTPDIERGDTATIEAKFGAVVLRVPGRADGPGSAGDTIPCRNLESGRRITCRVISSTQLEAVSAQ